MPVATSPQPKPKSSPAPITFLDAMQDPALFGPWFKPESSWAAWRVFAKALFGRSLDAAEVEVFSRHTGRSVAPASPFREAWVPVGRRGGKSIFAAGLAVYMAAFRDYRPHLKPGERAVVMVLAADKDQAGVVFDYIAGFFDNVPMRGQRGPSVTRYRCGTLSEIERGGVSITYDIAKSDVQARIMKALDLGLESFVSSDLARLDAGTFPEAKLAKLYGAEELKAAFASRKAKLRQAIKDLEAMERNLVPGAKREMLVSGDRRTVDANDAETGDWSELDDPGAREQGGDGRTKAMQRGKALKSFQAIADLLK